MLLAYFSNGGVSASQFQCAFSAMDDIMSFPDMQNRLNWQVIFTGLPVFFSSALPIQWFARLIYYLAEESDLFRLFGFCMTDEHREERP